MNLRKTSILAVCGLTLLGACAPAMTDTGTGATGLSRTQQGALAGAAVGALYGGTRDSDSNNQGRDAARAAIIGAAAGAVAGNILDRQAAALEQSISNPNVQIINRGSYLQVILPEGILFATGSAAVSGPAQTDLYAVARNLNQYPNSRVEVVGHTDSTGSEAVNDPLSVDRAAATRSYLASRGVEGRRIAVDGMGERHPIASNDTAEGRARNRRVEIFVGERAG